jgi:hypothetical protein
MLQDCLTPWVILIPISSPRAVRYFGGGPWTSVFFGIPVSTHGSKGCLCNEAEKQCSVLVIHKLEQFPACHVNLAMQNHPLDKENTKIVLQLLNSENEPQMDKFVSENQLFPNVES